MKEIFLLIVMIVLGCFIFYGTKHPLPPCTEWKTITQIEPISLENFWEKKITYIIRYSDGSLYQTDFIFGEKTGDKECVN